MSAASAGTAVATQSQEPQGSGGALEAPVPPLRRYRCDRGLPFWHKELLGLRRWVSRGLLGADLTSLSRWPLGPSPGRALGLPVGPQAPGLHTVSQPASRAPSYGLSTELLQDRPLLCICVPDTSGPSGGLGKCSQGASGDLQLPHSLLADLWAAPWPAGCGHAAGRLPGPHARLHGRGRGVCCFAGRAHSSS